MFTKMYAIGGMSCENCGSRIKSALKNRPEIIAVHIMLSESRAIISMQENLSVQAINSILKEAGNYSASEITDEEKPKKAKKRSAFLKFFQREKPCCR